MTRGLAVLINGSSLIISSEFNGGMFCDPGSNGYNLIESLRNVNDLKTFDYTLRCFNDDFFGYPDISLYRKPLPSIISFNSHSYISKWFSDYVFIRNALNHSYKIVDINGERLELQPEATAIYYFGSFFALANDWEPNFCLPDKQKKNFIHSYPTL